MSKSKSSMIKLDIIIPTFNRPKHLERAIKSCTNQSRLPDRIIVVDNGNNPETQAVVSRAKEETGDLIEYHRSPPLSGRGALKKGIEVSTGDWLILLDDDDFLLKDRVAKDHARVENLKEENVFLIQYSFVRCDYFRKVCWVHHVNDKELTLVNALSMKAFGPPPSVTIEGIAAKTLHPYNASEGWFDYDLYAALLLKGKAISGDGFGYVMDDTRLPSRETGNSEKSARYCLIHGDRYLMASGLELEVIRKIENKLNYEAGFYYGKNKMPIAAAKIARLRNIHSLKGVVIGFLSTLRSLLPVSFPLDLRGSSMYSFLRFSEKYSDISEEAICNNIL